MKRFLLLMALSLALLMVACTPYSPPQELDMQLNDIKELDSLLEKLSVYSDKELIAEFQSYADKAGKRDESLFAKEDETSQMLYAMMLELNYRNVELVDEPFIQIRDIFYRYACSPWQKLIANFAGPIRSFGSIQNDSANDVFIDNRDQIYIVGMTEGHMVSRNLGSRDAFLCKFDPQGKTLWAKQFGTAYSDEANGVAVDESGRIYVVGRMGYEDFVPFGFASQASSGIRAFIRAYSASGVELWTDQFGAIPGSWGTEVATNSNLVFMVGRDSGKNFVRSYTPTGGLRGQDSFSADAIEDVAVTSENYAYAVGWKRTAIPGQGGYQYRSYIRSYDARASLLRDFDFGLLQPRTAEAVKAMGIGLDTSDKVYVTGYTTAAFAGRHQGRRDAFVLSYSPSSGIVWQQQFGSSEDDQAVSIDVSPQNELFVAGRTTGNLAGPHVAYQDMFLHRFSNSGRLLTSTQVGTTGYDYTHSVAANSAGEAVVVGSLFANGIDAFAARIP